MREITSEIEISATTDQVWNVLTDLKQFSEWNPFIIKATGRIALGERIRLLLRLHDGLKMVIKPTIVHVEEGREFRWLGHFIIPGLIDGEHRFLIEPLDTLRLKLRQHEVYRGLLVPLLWWRLNKDARTGFEEMNKALKGRMEN